MGALATHDCFWLYFWLNDKVTLFLYASRLAWQCKTIANANYFWHSGENRSISLSTSGLAEDGLVASHYRSSSLGFRLKASDGHLTVFPLLRAAHPPSSNTLGVPPVHGNISILDAFQLVIIHSLEDVNLLVDPCCRCVKIFYSSPSSTNPSWVTAGCFPGSLIVAPVLCAFEKVGHVISLEGDDCVHFTEASETIPILNGSTL